MTRKERNGLRDLAARGGVVMSSEWTTGHSHRTRARDIPPYCEKISAYSASRMPKRIRRVFDAHPRCQFVIAIIDMRSANRELR
jgi:uracil phosphoribosyltransferase